MVTLSELRVEHEVVLNRAMELGKSISLLVTGQVIEAMPVMWRWSSFIKKAILPHFELEEKIIIPLLAQGSEKAKALAVELMEERTALREYFDRYLMLLQQATSSDPRLSELCYEMSSKLISHVLKEDMVMIPLVRKWLSITDEDELPAHALAILYQE